MLHLDMTSSGNGSNQTMDREKCPKCGRLFNHVQFVDHLFSSKECMRKYWEEEEKTHSVRMRHKKKFGF